MAQLSGTRVAVIATDGFEQSELTEPVKALQEAGAQVDVISNKAGEIKGMQHDKPGVSIQVDHTLNSVRPDDYDALHLPGGAMNADAIRMVPELQQFLRAFQSAGKPMAAICHAPWELISAGLAKGRKLTSYHTIQDDLRNAGAHWVDQEVVVDGNWVTSRQPSDLPAFDREMVKLFARVPAMSAR